MVRERESERMTAQVQTSVIVGKKEKKRIKQINQTLCRDDFLLILPRENQALQRRRRETDMQVKRDGKKEKERESQRLSKSRKGVLKMAARGFQHLSLSLSRRAIDKREREREMPHARRRRDARLPVCKNMQRKKKRENGVRTCIQVKQLK